MLIIPVHCLMIAYTNKGQAVFPNTVQYPVRSIGFICKNHAFWATLNGIHDFFAHA